MECFGLFVLNGPRVIPSGHSVQGEFDSKDVTFSRSLAFLKATVTQGPLWAYCNCRLLELKFGLRGKIRIDSAVAKLIAKATEVKRLGHFKYCCVDSHCSLRPNLIFKIEASVQRTVGTNGALR